MQHCLTKQELDILIDGDWSMVENEDFESLNTLLGDCRNWEREIVCFSYFLSQTLERKEKAGADCKLVLRRAFEMTADMWLLIQQFDADFVKYLFRRVRDRDVSLEDGLVETQSMLGQHLYE